MEKTVRITDMMIVWNTLAVIMDEKKIKLHQLLICNRLYKDESIWREIGNLSCSELSITITSYAGTTSIWLLGNFSLVFV
jgi:hypothetical protein